MLFIVLLHIWILSVAKEKPGWFFDDWAIGFVIVVIIEILIIDLLITSVFFSAFKCCKRKT